MDKNLAERVYKILDDSQKVIEDQSKQLAMSKEIIKALQLLDKNNQDRINILEKRLRELTADPIGGYYG
jgi:Ca2+-binding EF-hand superfamily protein